MRIAISVAFSPGLRTFCISGTSHVIHAALFDAITCALMFGESDAACRPCPAGRMNKILFKRPRSRESDRLAVGTHGMLSHERLYTVSFSYDTN